MTGTLETLRAAMAPSGTLRAVINLGNSLLASLDADGKPVPGFALDDCEPIWGDHIARIVKWKNTPKLSALAGQPVRLRFELSDADLFSFQFTESP